MGNVSTANLTLDLQHVDMTQGAKAASKRDRKDKDVKVAKSQLKVVC